MMKKFLCIILSCLLVSMASVAQNCEIPTDVMVSANSHQSLHVQWSLPGNTPSRLLLFNQSNIINHPGEGFNGADLSVLYGGQTTLGKNATYPDNGVADDIRLARQTGISKLSFFVYVEGASTTATPITGAYVSIYNERPLNAASTPIWASSNALPATCSWQTAYRVEANGIYTPDHYADTLRPIFKVEVEPNALLAPGDYWIAVSFVSATPNPVYVVPLVDAQHVTTGNAYTFEASLWQPWVDETSLEQMGMPMIVNGYHTDDEIVGFHVYRDGLLLNTAPVETSYFDDADTLQPENTYCYTIKTVCLNGLSPETAPACGTTFHDPCHIVELPYTENFDAFIDSFPTCWQRLCSDALADVLQTKVVSLTSTSSPVLKIFANNFQSGYAVAPMVDWNRLVMNDIVVSFKGYKTVQDAAVVVGVMTDPTDYYTFTAIDTVSPSSVNNYQEFLISLNSYHDIGTYVALKAIGGTVYVEDFKLQNSACMHPAAVHLAEVGSDYVKIAWDAIPGTAPFDVYYKQSGQSTWTEELNVIDDYLMIAGFGAEQNFSLEVRVKSSCGTDYISGSFSFTTTCQAVDVPFMEDFDFVELDNAVYNPMLPCWTRYNTSSSVLYPYIQDIISGSPYRNLVFNAEQSAAYAMLPAIDYSMPLLQLRLRAKKEDDADNQGKLIVGVVSTVTDIAGSFVPVATLNLTAQESDYVVSFANYTGSGNRIALKAGTPDDNISTYNMFYVDNIQVDVPNSCLEPVDLRQTGATTNTISLSWTPAIGTSPIAFTLAYRVAGDFVWTEINQITDTFYTLSGLNPNWNYEVKISAHCSDVSQSGYSFVKECSTLCETTVSAPYSMNFDHEELGALPACWQRGDAIVLPQVKESSDAYHSPLRCLVLPVEETWVSTPAILDPIQNLSISFYAYKNNVNCGTLQVFVADNPTDSTSFAYIGDAVPQTYGSWELFEFNLNTLSNVGPNKYVVFRIQNPFVNGRFYAIDDVQISEIAPCARPHQVAASNVTDSSTTLQWTSDNSVVSSEIRYKTVFEEDWHTISGVIGNNYNVVGLSVSSPYMAQVRHWCSSSESSAWSDEVHFTTQCGEIKYLPYQENFDRYGTGSGVHPVCWSYQYSQSSGVMYPYIYNIHAYSEPGAYYLRGSSTAYTIAALPKINEAIQISRLRLTFYAYANTNSKLQVGFIAEDMDVDTFVPWDTIETEPSQWLEYEVDFTGYTGSNRYIAFKEGRPFSAFIYIDNVNLDYQPTCQKPQNIVVAGLGSDYMELSWHPGGNEGQWEVSYKADSSLTWNSLMVTDTFCTINGLSASTNYSYKIRSVCGITDKSHFTSPQTVSTLCENIMELPYHEGFDTYGTYQSTDEEVVPPCWKSQVIYPTGHVSTTLHITGDSYYVFSGIGSLQVYNQAPSYTVMALPALDASIDKDYVKISLDAKLYYSSDLTVGMMTNPLDPSTFTAIPMTLVVSYGSNWYHAEAYLSDYHGTGRFIAFKNGSANGDGYSYLDNIEIDYTACPAPNAAFASNITQNTASIHWTQDAIATSWEYVYGLAGFDPDTAFVYESYDNTILVQNLVPGSMYDFYVRNNCAGSAYSNWSPALRFATACVEAHIPYQEDFDGWNTSIASSYSVFPPCWKMTGNGTSTLSNLAHQYYFTAPAALNISNTGNQYCYASTPFFVDTLSLLQVSFLGKFNYMNRSVEVGVMENPLDTSTFTPVETINARTTVWNEYIVPLTSYQGTGHYVAFRLQGDLSTEFYLDNLSIDYAPVCVSPVHLNISDIQIQSAEVDWTPGRNETAWQVAIGPAGFNPETDGAGVVETVFNHPYTLSNLTDASFYDVYVRAICQDGSYSDWSSAASFRTACYPINAIPYNESFDSLGTSNYAFPLCWERNSTSLYAPNVWFPYATSTAYNGTRSLYFHSSSQDYCIATLPLIGDAISLDTIQLRFQVRRPATGELQVGVMTNPYDISSFESIRTVNPSSANVWQEVVVPFDTYTGNGRYIAFKSQATVYNSFYIDDVNLERIPTCIEPSDFHIVSTTANSITLAWTDTINHNNQWQISYGFLGVQPEIGSTEVMAGTNPFTITGLTEASYYDFYIRAYCDVDDQSGWIGPIMAQTDCDSPKALPYTENFDSYAYTAVSEHHILPECWQAYRNSNQQFLPHIVRGSYNWTYPNSLMMEARNPGHSSYAVLPEMDGDLGTLQVIFWKRMSNEFAKLEIGYVTDNLDTTTFHLLQSVANVVNMSGAYDTINFNNYSNIPQNGYVAFRFSALNNDNSSCGIDDILIMDATPVECLTPTNLTVREVLYTSAIVEWTPVGDETSWSFLMKAEDDEYFVGRSVFAAGVNINDLRPGTHYFAKVSAICGALWESPETELVDFWTLGDTTSIDNNEWFDSIELFPNPHTGQFTIRYHQSSINNVRIFDVYGKLLKIVEVNDSDAKIDMNDCAGGIYFIQIETENGIVTKRVVKK